MVEYVDSEAVADLDNPSLCVKQVMSGQKPSKANKEKSTRDLDRKGHWTELAVVGRLGVSYRLTFLSGLISRMFLR